MDTVRFIEDANGIADFFHVGVAHGVTHAFAKVGVEGRDVRVGGCFVEDGDYS